MCVTLLQSSVAITSTPATKNKVKNVCVLVLGSVWFHLMESLGFPCYSVKAWAVLCCLSCVETHAGK